MTQQSTGKLDGQVAIITGGSSGIGLATARAFASERAHVVIVGNNSDHVRSALEDIRTISSGMTSVLGFTLDVRLEPDMCEMASRSLAMLGRIDILVASAGIGKRQNSTNSVPRPLAQLPVDDWDAIVDTNLKGVFLSNRAVLRAMIRQRKGHIVNISSSPGGIMGQPFSAAYCASKFGVNGLSQALGAEVRPYGIRVHVVFPDATDTPLIRNTTLTARLGQPLPPSRVANHIVSLVSTPSDTVWPASDYTPYSILRAAFPDAQWR